MAPLTRAIQRKSIHKFSTGGARTAAPVRALLLCLFPLSLFLSLGGCAGSGGGAIPSGTRALVPTADTTHLSPGQTGTLRFLLTSGGVPLPGQTVAYSITNPADAQGATLDAAQATTDALGISVLSVRAGLETEFLVHATSGSAQVDSLVVVAAGDTGSLEIAPFFAPSGHAMKRASKVEVRFLSRTTCSAIVPVNPPPDPVREIRIQDGIVKGIRSETYHVIKRSDVNATVGRAFDLHGAIVAAGCMDVSGASLLPDDVVRVALRLDDAVAYPVGTFAVTSWLFFSPPLAAAQVVAAPWRDLTDCPLDPAQLWLDCTIDALSPASPSDPLDCVPAPGGEGALGTALTARRGVGILDRAGNDSGCRGPTDAGGSISLDATLLGLYGSPLPFAVAELPAIAEQAAHILDQVVLNSSIEIIPGGTPSTFLVTHTLSSATFGKGGAQAEVSLQALGLPVLTAHTTAAIDDGLLVVDSQAFTLRLGTVARTALSRLALEDRGLPGDAAGLVALLATLARSNDGATVGCAAMDAKLCAAAGYPAGCLMAACSAGLSALAGRLDGAFAAADGTGVDLVLSGSAPPLDGHMPGVAARLGRDDWSVELRTTLGRTSLSAMFDAIRIGS